VWRRIASLVVKELLQMVRSPASRFLLWGPPIIQMLMFGYAANLEVRHVATAVLDHDHTQASRELIARFAHSPYFDVVVRADDRAALRQAIDRGRAQVGIAIDAGFADRLRDGRGAPVQAVVDATASNTALIALGYVEQVVARYARELEEDQLRRSHPEWIGRVPDVKVEFRPWYNPDLLSRWFFLPGVVGTITLITIMTLTAFSVVREREIGTLEQMMVTPIRRSEFILGKMIPSYLVGVVNITLIAAVGRFWFHLPFRGSLVLFAVGASLFILCTIGFGLLLSTVSETQQQAMLLSSFITTPAFMLSGFVNPISNMARPLQWLSYLDPLRYFMDVLRSIYLKGVGLRVLWPDLLAMALFAVLLLTVSILRFRKSLE
jgi:ABC-2 type transport system permease protein